MGLNVISRQRILCTFSAAVCSVSTLAPYRFRFVQWGR